MTALLEIQDLHTSFFTRESTVRAVNGLSLSLKPGETVGLVGESGCGKSVSALSVMRLVPPPGRIVSGRILFEGRDLLQLSEEQMRRIRGNRIATIPQDPMTSLNPVLTIGRQITEALAIHKGLSPNDARQRAIELLRLVDIPEAEARIDDYPYRLSGGMRQRVMVAMALSCEPQLLIADEPTTALDVTIQAQIVDLIKRLRHELGMAVIWITHDLGMVAGLADKVAVMYAGHLLEEAPVRDLYQEPHHPYTRGLLASLPRLNAPRSDRLLPIEGVPPDFALLPRGCPFYPRCRHRIERCLAERPELRYMKPRHRVACWVDVARQGQRR